MTAGHWTPCLNPATLSGPPLTSFLKLAAAAGFTAVEVPIQQVVAHGLEPTASLLGDLGLSVAAASGILPDGPVMPHPLLIGDDAFTSALDGLDTRLAAFQAISCPVATTVLNPRHRTGTAAARAVAATRIGELGRACDAAGVVLAVETVGVQASLPPGLDGPHPVLSTLPDLRTLLDEATAGTLTGVAACVDSFHWAAAGEGPASMDGLPVAHVQIADAPPGVPTGEWTDAMRVFPGEGTLDWARFSDALHSAAYTGAVSVELFNPDLRALPDREIARRALEGARTCFGGRR